MNSIMKKYLFAFAVMALGCGFESAAQNETPFSMNVAGFNLRIGDSVKQGKISLAQPSHQKRSFNLLSFYHGWNIPVQSEYYGDWAGKGDFLKPSDAFSFGMSFCRFSLGINRSNSLKFNISGRWTYTNYRFQNGIILKDTTPGGNTMPIFESSTEHAKFFSSYLGIPIGLSYEFDEDFRLYANISAEFLTASFAKYKNSRDKSPISCLNKFKSTAELVFCYKCVGAYLAYNLTPMFSKGSGNDAHAMTMGFVFGF